MYFKATEEQVKKMGALAANASMPMGNGFIHYQPNRVFAPTEMELRPGRATGKRELYLDYVQGRMVKLCIEEAEGNPGYWVVSRGSRPTPDYQSWITTYPTIEDLAKAAGIESHCMHLTASQMVPY